MYNYKGVTSPDVYVALFCCPMLYVDLCCCTVVHIDLFLLSVAVMLCTCTQSFASRFLAGNNYFLPVNYKKIQLSCSMLLYVFLRCFALSHVACFAMLHVTARGTSRLQESFADRPETHYLLLPGNRYAMQAADCTHEVADCSPHEVVPPSWCRWEPCTIIKNNRDTCDVRIFADDGVIVNCQLVPKRFVRPLAKPAKSTPSKKRKYGWSKNELAHLQDAKRARLDALARGERASQPRAWIRKYLANQGVEKRSCCVKLSINGAC